MVADLRRMAFLIVSEAQLLVVLSLSVTAANLDGVVVDAEIGDVLKEPLALAVHRSRQLSVSLPFLFGPGLFNGVLHDGVEQQLLQVDVLGLLVGD